MNVNVPNVSIHSSLASKYDDPSVVLQWAEKMQHKFGDSLTNSSQISLPTTCQVSFTQNDLTKLKAIWEILTPERRFVFSKKYGQIADLMYIPVNHFTLRAIVHFWDPAYRCFTFGSFDLSPTIEEYQAMLNISEKEEDKIYCFNPKLTAKRTLSKLLANIHAADIQKHMKIKGEEESISIDYLTGLAQTYLNEDKGLTLLALCIYGMVLFPKAKGYVDGKVAKLFVDIEQGINPVMPLLAETFRSLNYCRIRGEGKLNCCVPLLYIWLHSHIKCPQEFKCPKIDFSSPWNLTRNTISEFGVAAWDQTYPKKEAWMSFFATIKLENIIWKAQWMPLKAMTYRCGDFHSVPLLGPWGGIHHAPLLVLRQMWFKQFIPVTHNLKDLEFSYNLEGFSEKKRQAVNAWKSVRKLNNKGHYEGVTNEYEAWQMNRKKSIAEFIPKGEDKNSEEIEHNRPRQWAEEYGKIEERNRVLEQENKKLREEANQWMNHAVQIQKELEKTKGFLRNQNELEKNYEALDREMRQMSKENRSLKNERAALRVTLNSQKDCIKDVEGGKVFLLELISDLHTSISKQKTQIIELEKDNHSLRQTLDNLQMKIAEHSEENGILKNCAESLHFQLIAYQNASEKILQKCDQLEAENKELKRDYDLQRKDFQMILGHVDQTIDILRMMARRASGYAEWATELRANVSPMQSNADDLNKFLGMICRELGHFGRFH